MKKYKCLIVDDETLARELLTDYVSKIPYLELAGTCANAIEAKFALQEKKIDILFLDIQMPDLTGLELLRMLKKKPATILTTAYSEHALEGYELDVLDYLLKPIEFERFFKAVSKAVEWLGKDALHTKSTEVEAVSNTLDSSPQTSTQTEKYFFVKSDYKIVKVEFDEILFVEALQKYVRIHTSKERIVTLLSLSKLLESLPANQFIRIHRSYVINIDKVDSIEGNMVRIGKHNLRISKGQKEAFLEFVKEKGIFL